MWWTCQFYHLTDTINEVTAFYSDTEQFPGNVSKCYYLFSKLKEGLTQLLYLDNINNISCHNSYLVVQKNSQIFSDHLKF